jgi:hypothetical protein
MPRLQAIPEELKRRAVTIADAERLGFSRQHFRGPNWRRAGLWDLRLGGPRGGPKERARGRGVCSQV